VVTEIAVLRSDGETMFSIIPIRIGSVYPKTNTMNQRQTPKMYRFSTIDVDKDATKRIIYTISTCKKAPLVLYPPSLVVMMLPIIDPTNGAVRIQIRNISSTKFP
jgi:hypothetical protein